VVVAEELQEQLLAQEEELTRREEALAAREEKARILEKALATVSADLDAERAKAKATWKEYLDKIEAHNTHTKHSLCLDRMLGERKVKLDGRERDLSVHEAALAEAQSRGLNPRDNHEELMEVIELRRLLQDAKVEHVTKAGQLVILAWDISEVLVDLGMLPILGIHAWLAMSWMRWASTWSTCGRPTPPTMAPGIRHHSFIALVSIIRPALVFCFVSILFLVCETF
jgi:hypothetical protein